MNIKNYTSYFHDGGIIAIEQNGSNIVLSMESAEISPEENIDNLPLSENRTLKGKLHLEEVKNITEREQQIQNPLKMLYDSADILHFEMGESKICLDLEWVNFPPHQKITAYSFYVIHAKRIWWENLPDLQDPLW